MTYQLKQTTIYNNYRQCAACSGVKLIAFFRDKSGRVRKKCNDCRDGMARDRESRSIPEALFCHGCGEKRPKERFMDRNGRLRLKCDDCRSKVRSGRKPPPDYDAAAVLALMGWRR